MSSRQGSTARLVSVAHSSWQCVYLRAVGCEGDRAKGVQTTVEALAVVSLSLGREEVGGATRIRASRPLQVRYLSGPGTLAG